MAPPVIMWFRQDLRLAENAALNAAARAGEVICLYVLDDETPGPWKWGGASRWWLHKSLEALSTQVKLILRRGRADEVLRDVLAETKATAVFLTRDYAPWAGALEQRVKQVAEAQGAGCHRFGGFLLHEPEAIRSGAGTPFKVYTPFSRACFAAGEPKLPGTEVPRMRMWKGEVKSDDLTDWKLLPTDPNWAQGFEHVWTPGERGAHTALQAFLDDGLAHYADGRDRPDQPYTSRLSPRLHWGELNPAQCWHAVRNEMAQRGGLIDAAGEKFLKELLWREFSYHIIHHWPQTLTQPFKPEYGGFPWNPQPSVLKKWQRGETGYPIVDAGMRELWATGILHNRVRMIVASFLTKHLLQDWREGASWFWDTLVDADIASNTASWQWVAGSGADAAPYFRIFNPILQGRKFDPNGEYVRKWLPELADVPNEYVHEPWNAPPANKPRTYPQPMIEHEFARRRALEALKAIKVAAA
jgi:deoxyribodipyrimidine photo-lyase